MAFVLPPAIAFTLTLRAQTDSTIDSEGWLHSGDIGVWLPNGALKIM